MDFLNQTQNAVSAGLHHTSKIISRLPDGTYHPLGRRFSIPAYPPPSAHILKREEVCALRKKLLSAVIVYILIAVLLLPLLVTLLCGGFHREVPQSAELYGTEDLAPLPSELEEYVAGVVAAEMPASFPEEALKAQAVAARTYEVRQMRAAGSDSVLYDVGQAYADEAAQREKWGENYGQYAAKIRRAVRETAGEIMVYDGEPILAAFHAQSGGKTENAENVWDSPLPYLKSVDSAEDKAAPGYETEVSFSTKEVLQQLKTQGTPTQTAENLSIEILSRTDAGYVSEVSAGGLKLTGRQLRETLGLRSANFTVEKQANSFVFRTYGYGHGAGMSQYGASYLAEKGLDYHEILNHYYTNVNFERLA